MPRTAKLKVYRTPIGFHDAYVAASSQKAALQAWGSERDLFARGVAELVTDDALTAEPLASPGKVVRRSRGTAAEQIAALPKSKPSRKVAELSRDESDQDAAVRRKTAPAPSRSEPPPKPKPPRPSRGRLDEAEAALVDLEKRQSREKRELEGRQAQLARERKQLETSHASEIKTLERARDNEASRYQADLARWKEA